MPGTVSRMASWIAGTATMPQAQRSTTQVRRGRGAWVGSSPKSAASGGGKDANGAPDGIGAAGRDSVIVTA